MSTPPVAPPSPSPAAESMLNSNSNTVCELSQRFYFEAAHTLNRGIETESSRRIHGHTYEAEVTVAGQPDATSGMLIDLGYLRSEITRVREMLDHRNRLANSPLSTQTSSDKNGWKTKPCPQVYPLNKPVSDVGHAEPASGSQSTMASLYTSAPHTP